MPRTERQVFPSRFIAVPPGQTNVWGVREVELTEGRCMVMDEFEDGDHRLRAATWPDISFTNFVQLVYDQTASLSWQKNVKGETKGLAGVTYLASGGRQELSNALHNVTPATLARMINEFRFRHMGPGSFTPAYIVSTEAADQINYLTSKRDRELIWTYNRETDQGVLEIDFGANGSHNYLAQLIERFGFPKEALQPIEEPVAVTV